MGGMLFYFMLIELAVDILTYLMVMESKLPVIVSELRMFFLKPLVTLCNDDDFTGGNSGNKPMFSFYGSASFFDYLDSESFTNDLYF